MRYGKSASRAALAILLVALAAGGFPQATTLSTLDEIAALGKEKSLDYAKALLSARQAEADIPALIKAKSSTLTTSYSHAGASGTSGASESSTDEVTASLSVPIVDQASLSASVSDDLSSKVSASLSPLAHADDRTQARIAYEKAVAAADEAGMSAGSSAVKAALAWMSLERQLATKDALATNYEEIYRATKAAREIDPDNVSLDDVSDALKDWQDANAALVKLKSSERSSAAELRSLLGGGDVSVAGLGMDALAAALGALKSSLADATSSGAAEGYDVKAAALDLRSASSTVKSTWLFEPSLSVSAGFSFSSEGDPSPLVSASLTLSLDDLKGEELSRAKGELELAGKTLAKAKATQESDYAAAVSAVQAAEIATEGLETARDQAAEVRDEAAFLLKSGEYSVLENQSAVLSLATAEDSLYQSLVDEYSAWLDLAALAGK